MADIYLARAAAERETNCFQECFQSYSKQHACIMACLKSNQLKSPSQQEALAYGGMGNGCMAVDEFERAEEWYLKAFDVWDRLAESSKSRQIYVSRVRLLEELFYAYNMTGCEHGGMLLSSRKACGSRRHLTGGPLRLGRFNKLQVRHFC